MNNILRFAYWFDAYPLPFNQTTFYLVSLVFLSGIILGVIAQLLKRKNRQNVLVGRIWQKLYVFGYSFGAVGYILFFLKQQRAPYLGMRLWIGLWLVACLVWLVFILKYIFIEVPKVKKIKKEKEELKKYLP